MATELAKAYVQIIPSAEGISGNLSNILGGEAQKAGASSGKTFSSAFSGGVSKGLAAIGGAATLAATGITAVGTSIVSNAKETAAYGDNIDKLSQKIGISAEAFQEWDYVFSQNGTDIGILQTGMKKLSDSFADAAGGSSSAIAKFEALGLSMQDLQGLSQEDLFSTVVEKLQEMGPSAERTAIAADLLGKSATELGPLFNQTAADTEALKQQAHDLGMVMTNDAVKASAAFTDAMDNLKRAATGAKNTLSAQFLPSLTEITNGFANLIAGNEGATDQIKAGFEGLASSIAETIPSIMTAFTSIVDAVASVAPEIIQSLGDGILQALPQLTSTIMGILPQLTSVFLQMLPELVDIGMKMLIEIGNGIAQALPELIPQITTCILDMVDAFLANLPELIEVGVQIILALVDGIVQALPELIARLPEIISQIVTALMESLPELLQGAVQLVTMLAQHAPEIIQALIEAIPQMIESLVGALTDADSLAALIEGFVELFIALAAAWPQIIQALVEAVPQLITAIVSALGELGPQLIQTFAQIMVNVAPAFDKLAVAASNAWAKIQTVFASVGSWFSTKFNEAANAVKNAFETVKSFFQKIWNDILSIFSDVGKKFTDIGKNIVAGLKKGITDAWGNLKDTVKDKVGDLVDGAKGALKIESPSKVFADQVGQWIPAGIALGIEQGMPMLTQAIDDMTGDMLTDSVQTTVDSVNSLNYAPAVPATSQETKTAQLLAEYLPIIAQGMDVDVTVKQNDSGVFEAVRRQNNKLVTSTGYHALA